MDHTKNILPTLRIIQFNCGHMNHTKARPFFDSLNPKTQHIIALQEPHIFEKTQSTYTPLGYTLAMSRDPTTRVAFLISQELHIAEWEWRNHSPFIASLVLSLTGKECHILNIYHPSTNEGIEMPPLHQLREILADTLARGAGGQGMTEKPLVLLGDFNLHHPSWGGDHIVADREASTLIEIINSFGLNLLLPRGEATWQRGGIETTIDLVFSTPYLTQRLTMCQVRKDWGLGDDHNPILIEFDVQPWKQVQQEWFALKRLRKKELRQLLFKSLQGNQLLPTGASLSEDMELEASEGEQVKVRGEPQEIERVIRVLSTSLWEALESSCPKVTPSEHARRGWSTECHDLVKDQRRARRCAA